MRKLFIGFATFALAIGMAASSSYKLNLLQPSIITISAAKNPIPLPTENTPSLRSIL